MSDEQKTSALTWAKFVFGAFSFVGLILIHVYVKELPVMLICLPGLLMGIDPSSFFGGRK